MGTRRQLKGLLAMLLVAGAFALIGGGIRSLAQSTPAAEEGVVQTDAYQAPTRVPPTELVPTAMERVDRIFADIVAKMQGVLFYPLFAHERSFVQFDDQQHYWRPVDSEAEFVSVDNPDDTLDEADLRRLRSAESLLADARGQLIRKGEWEGQEVEFVAVSNNRGKFVLGEDGRFHKLLARERLSESETITWQDAERAALAGQLTVVTTAAGDQTKITYVQREQTSGAPIVVLWLACGAVFFTIYMRGYNLRGFTHALTIVRGRYDNPDEPGEVTHFQALASALSATVGLGNIAGVTIAMTTGGPGAFFWMMLCGFFGMTSKFVECTLGQRYRTVKPDGTVLGGPMQYLHVGLKEQFGLGGIGFVLSIVFAVMCILASFGGGNMFQSNQSGQQVQYLLRMADNNRLQEIRLEMQTAAADDNQEQLVVLEDERKAIQTRDREFQSWFPPVYGLILAAFVGIVIIGGIKRIGAAAEKVVPSMCLIYLAACIYIIAVNITQVPAMFALIFTEAFNPEAFGGGMLGVLVIGVQRAAFSNEAGVGSASIAHSAAKTDEPVREGTVALLGPFIDTVVVCSMTALVILITGAWSNEEWTVQQGLSGAPLTTKAFESVIPWFPYVLCVAVVLFAYSTLISWSYYGERCWERLFGVRSTVVYKILYVGAVFLGAIVNLGAVLDFSDMMILSMAFPNIFGLVLLTPLVWRDLNSYWTRYKDGQFKTYK